MHDSAYNWLAKMAAMLPPRQRVVEFGSRNVNGTARPLFPLTCYVGIDRAPGPGVDVVCDACMWCPPAGFEPFDTVICSETLEHAENAGDVCGNAYMTLAHGGVMLVTAASTEREPHSAIDGGPLQDGEFYRNVSAADLRKWLDRFGCVLIDESSPGDVYALAVKTR